MNNKKVISYLLIGNLTLIFLFLLNKFKIVHEFADVFVLVIFTPIIFSIFLFYILRPLNEVFIRKGMKKNLASLLTLIIFIVAIIGFTSYFSEYFLEQIFKLKEYINSTIRDNQIGQLSLDNMKTEDIKGFFNNFSDKIMGYLVSLFSNVKNIFNKGMMIFSDLILVFLITFFLLKDGHIFKETVLKFSKEKYKAVTSKILSEGDKVLSTYIIGQATVALSLSLMVLVGYLIIGMPSACFLAFTTFILAFIPFLGFFISMIVPYVIAIAMGFDMVLKLSLLFLIAQTLKGRVVVPFIMGRAMKIHPITDIFLVVCGAAIGGPIVAFCIVPIYSLLKVVFKNLKKDGIIKINIK
ncbi:MAG: AI-2E family transporter [Terrisporobacter sp.]